MINLSVNILDKEKSYPVFIDNFDVSKIKDFIFNHKNYKNYIVVISEKVEKLYGKFLGFNKDNVFILKDGEKEKNFSNYQKIMNFCLKKRLDRKDAIIAVGGGVVGDISGFVASTYMRGIDFIQIPTTLLSAIDSSVGGKTAVNSSFGKNLIGSFYQPSAVFINTNFLKTLNIKELKSGLGEVVKYAFIEKSCLCNQDFNIINFLSENYEKILNYDEKIFKDLIKFCILLKISVVEKDEKESNLRKILNLGHTYGHAIENLTGYKKYSHGECVVEGIIFAFDLALKNNLIDKNYQYLMLDVLKKFNFKKIPNFDLKKIIPIMKTDKKSENGKFNFVLPCDYACVKDFYLNDDFTIS